MCVEQAEVGRWEVRDTDYGRAHSARSIRAVFIVVEVHVLSHLFVGHS